MLNNIKYRKSHMLKNICTNVYYDLILNPAGIAGHLNSHLDT